MAQNSGTPVFSVIIPTYNRSDIIRSTLESVQRQTYTDFECLVVDDGSPDGEELAAVVESMSDDRFRCIRQANGGASSARNHGFDLARGHYIALLDDDDAFLPKKLETCLEILRRHSDEVLLYSQMVVERGLDKKWIRPSRGALPSERIDEYILCTPGTIRTSTIVFTASLAQRIRFDESLPWFQDSDFAIRSANSGAAFEFVAEPLVVLHDEIGYSRVSRNKSYESVLVYFEKMRRSGAISERSYWAARGWPCARVASSSNRPYAVRLYLEAMLKGVFPARHAVIVGAQVMVPYRVYQYLANVVVRIRGRRLP
ncbi:glycosyltransferase family 2 protein [Mycobacterium sp. ZZG]